MGTWSISPNTGLVSINQLGVVTYQEHTENKNYTIKYSDSTCGEITKSITINKCVSPSTSKANVLIMNDNHQSINIASLTFHIGLNSYKATPDGSGTVTQCDGAELISTVTPALPENPTFGMSVNAKLADGSSINGTFEGYTPGNPPTLSAKLGNNGCI